MNDDAIIKLSHSILDPLDIWAHRCHGASFALVNHKEFPKARVARGWCKGVISQHSWVVLGEDCYDDEALIIDSTLWSYDPEAQGRATGKIWVGTIEDGRHNPHGKGSIWDWGRPDEAEEDPVILKEPDEWSPQAKGFIDLLGPLDRKGWTKLAHAPVEEWPSREIIEAIDDHYPGVVPIDIIGMLTNRNPGGLYLRSGYEDEF